MKTSGYLLPTQSSLRDIGRLFNHLSGMAQETQYKRLLVAPHGIRNGLIDRINHEIANHEDGKPAGIRIKVNSIVDEATSDALYRGFAGRRSHHLWVRGICTIRPGVPGLSENIRIRSILGRFLEHSRLVLVRQRLGRHRLASALLT
jgi:polyphosphate kinase